MSRHPFALRLFKVALGIVGFLVGGYAGFWIAAFAADAALPPVQHHLAEPGTGMASGLIGLFVGLPLGGLSVCVLAVMYAETIASRIGDLVRRLRKR